MSKVATEIKIDGTWYELIAMPNMPKKPVLFTTSDGKEIREGDRVWWVVIHYRDGAWTINSDKMKSTSSFNHDRVFSTEEAVKEYILMNKPCLSIEDVRKCVYLLVIKEEEKLKELAKQKIK
jgi:hypothetical protein